MLKEVIGRATLYCGDARDVTPGLAVDTVITSPPYGQQRDYGAKISDWRDIVSGVLCPLGECGDTQIFVNLGLVHRDGEVIGYWDPFLSDMRQQGWRFFGWYVWDQGSGMAGDWNGRLAPSHEFVFHFNHAARKPNKFKPTKGGVIHGPGLRTASGKSGKKTGEGQAVQPFKIPDSVIRTPRETSGGPDAEHPARFPVKFARELVAAYANPGMTVLDPFLGSGTTGVAAVQHGCDFIGVELEPRYFDIACRRIEDAQRQRDLFIDTAA
jgi:DNA modification methylase